MRSKATSIFSFKWFRWLARITVAVSLLFLVLTQVDLSSALMALDEVSVMQLIPILFIYLAIRFIWAWQMSLGLFPLDIDFSVFYLFKTFLISGYYSLVLPGGMVTGSVAFLYKLSSINRKLIEASALLTYFRLVNTLVIFTIGLLGMIFDQRLAQPLLKNVIAFVFFLALLLFLPLFSSRIANILNSLLNRLVERVGIKNKAINLIISLWQGLVTMTKLSKLVVALTFGLSLTANFLGILLYCMIANSLNLELSVFTLGWIRTILTILQMLPLSIGGLGVRELSVVYFLREYGVLESKSLAFSLILFLLLVVTGIFGGVLESIDVLNSQEC